MSSSSLAFRPDGGQLASASFDQSVRLWNLSNGQPDGVFTGHSDFVYDVAYAPDGQSFLSVEQGPDDQAHRRENSEREADVQQPQRGCHGPGGSAGEPARQIRQRGHRPQLRLGGGSTTRSRRIGSTRHGGPVHQLAFSGNGKRLISAGGDASIKLWDGGSGTLQPDLVGQPPSGSMRRPFPTTPASRPEAAGTGWSASGMPTRGSSAPTLVQPPHSAHPPTTGWSSHQRLPASVARTSPARSMADREYRGRRDNPLVGL